MSKLLKVVRSAVCVLGCGLAASPAIGALPNPLPGVLEDDTGAQLFTVDPASPYMLGVQEGGTSLVQFGFFFSGSSDAHPIFEPTDPAGTVAFVNFADGTIANLTTSSLTSVFTPSPAPIIFYSVFLTGDPALISTLNLLNPGGADLAGTYPVIGTSDQLLLFTRPTSAGLDFSVDVVAGVSPLASIPEPSTWLLLVLGLSMLWMRARQVH